MQAFWLLDHEDFEEAVNMLLDPLISGNDIEPWQHRFSVGSISIPIHLGFSLSE